DDYQTHLRNGRNFMRRNREEIRPAGHATDLFTEWACDFLRSRAERTEPFFLYLAYNAPHDPLQPPPEWLEKVQRREAGISDKRARLVALIEHMDDGIGKVLRTLEATGQSPKTLVVFTSDNGGLLNDEARNGPWRSGKQHMYEGGLRVPCAARWPERIAPRSRCERPAVTMDLFPTALEAAGLAPGEGIDGVSLLPMLVDRQDAAPSREFYFVRREGGAAYGGKTIEALRRGDWKLVQDSPFGPPELFHLGRDPRETTNLAEREPRVLGEMSAALRGHIQRGGAVPWQPPVSGTR
ncbi:MAG TPA: sulfatase-like hydrolase/transferase, partial [Planctomycetaceae bacterium]|nr:sulfatase-like hydrolase/transferase [Planctomycetaceae bacterium]